jgi:hypothetical protein
MADKCARTMERHAWHSQPVPEVGKAGKPEAETAAQSSSKNRNRKKKKVGANNKSLAGAPTIVATAAATGGGRDPRGNKLSWQPSSSDEGGPRCLIHNSRHHSSEECREIKKLAEQF